MAQPTSLVVYLSLMIACCTVMVSSQRLGPLAFGKCPKIPEMTEFDINKFEGKWYEVERSFYLMEISSSCTTLTFVPDTSGDLNVTINTLNRWTGSPSISLGKASPIGTQSATLKYRVDTKLPSALARALPGAGTYVILHTDYDNYAIMWSCSNMGFMHSDLVWVLGRERDLPVWARAEVYDRLHQSELNSDRLTLSKNDDCPNF